MAGIARRWCGVWSLVVLAQALVFGSANDRSIAQFVHTAWTAKNGVPANISALAQTTDGFLWLGTPQGLYRFDGVVFERYQPEAGSAFPSNHVVSLLALPDGDLWIGFRNGLCRLRNGHLTNYADVDGRPLENVRTVVHDREGVLWAGGNAGLVRFEQNRWSVVREDWGYPSDKVRTMFVDRDGTLWVATTDTLLFLPRGARKFQTTGVESGVVAQIAQSPDGSLWMAETSRSVRTFLLGKDAGGPQSEIEVGSDAILFADDGSLWITTLGDGMRRVTSPDKLNGRKVGRFSQTIESLTRKDGLTSDYSIHILQDRERNIWVATSAGLDQFRKGTFVPVYLPAVLERKSLVAGANGNLWVASLSGGHAWVNGNSWKEANISDATPYGVADARGITLLSVDLPNPRLLRLESGKLTTIAAKLPGLETWELGNLIARDGSGTLWLVAGPNQLSFLKNGKWGQLAIPSEAAGQRAWAAYTDTEGRVWFGFANSLLVLDHGRVRTFTAKDGVRGAVYAIALCNGHTWIGGPAGLAILQGDHFRAVTRTVGDPYYVTGILEDAGGNLFVSEPAGVSFIPAAEISRALQNGTSVAHDQLYDERDGLPGAIQQGVLFPSSVQSTDGRFWFSAAGGVAWIDPSRITKNMLPPPVTIRSIIANKKVYSSSSGLRLPAPTKDLLIDYTALSLAIPERVRFRYKLEGYDQDWQDAGTRREAAYTNLNPRQYRFRVVACNNDGVWNETGASLEFSILPAWYQTLWFRSAGIATFALALWTLYQFRLRRLEQQYSARIEERVSERTRIARELHDTLLQSLHGLMFEFQAARNMLPRKPEEAMHALDAAICGTEETIAESRDAIHDLRSEAFTEGDLAELLENVGKELAVAQPPGHNAPAFRVIVEGEPQSLAALVQGEVYHIIVEVVRNAFHHSNARQIEVEIRYDKHRVRLRVRDDGKGIDPGVLEQSRRPGHWGLPGVRERARRIGARLDFWSQTGAGTEVELTVPGAIAYKASSADPRFKRFRKAGNREQSS